MSSKPDQIVLDHLLTHTQLADRAATMTVEELREHQRLWVVQAEQNGRIAQLQKIAPILCTATKHQYGRNWNELLTDWGNGLRITLTKLGSLSTVGFAHPGDYFTICVFLNAKATRMGDLFVTYTYGEEFLIDANGAITEKDQNSPELARYRENNLYIPGTWETSLTRLEREADAIIALSIEQEMEQDKEALLKRLQII